MAGIPKSALGTSLLGVETSYFGFGSTASYAANALAMGIVGYLIYLFLWKRLRSRQQHEKKRYAVIEVLMLGIGYSLFIAQVRMGMPAIAADVFKKPFMGAAHYWLISRGVACEVSRKVDGRAVSEPVNGS